MVLTDDSCWRQSVGKHIIMVIDNNNLGMCTLRTDRQKTKERVDKYLLRCISFSFLQKDYMCSLSREVVAEGLLGCSVAVQSSKLLT